MAQASTIFAYLLGPGPKDITVVTMVRIILLCWCLFVLSLADLFANKKESSDLMLTHIVSTTDMNGRTRLICPVPGKVGREIIFAVSMREVVG